ncbi:MAG: MFS transporter [Dehalococcoidia bacterium]
MNLLTSSLQRVNFFAGFRELASSRQRRETLLALGFGNLLVQITFLPVTLTIPSVASYFGADVDDAAWTVIIRLLALGSTVFLSARLGERYGHVRLFVLGAVVMSLGNLMAATSQSLGQLILWSGMGGLGGGLITANANAMLVMVFESSERGRAFSVPVTASRIGTFIGLGLFGVFLHFFDWRWVFATSFLIGLISIKYAWPMLKYQYQQTAESRPAISINFFGAALLVAVLAVFTLSGSHLHEGSESYTSPEAISYHLPMSLVAVGLGALFVVLQLRSREPYLDFRYFKRKIFSMALFSNSTFHLSMLTIFTLVPIVMEDGLGHTPIAVSLVLLTHQSFGLWLPPIAGWLFDRYNPRWLGPIALFMVASGVTLLGLFAPDVPIWGIPLLLLPASVGTGLFITPYNALVMNTLPDNRSFASGMLETTRQMGHTVGTTIGAMVLGLSLPATIELMTAAEAQVYYQQGFQTAIFVVVWVIIAGGVVAVFQRLPPRGALSSSQGAESPSAVAPF